MAISFIDKILLEAKTVLTERVLNIWTDDIELRKKYGQEVFDILQLSYKGIGGIHGNGFKSVEDMIKNIPLWKIVKRGDEITAVVMYKDKEGRKRVAAGQNGTPDAKIDWKNISKDEINRSYSEISKAPLAIQNKLVPNLENYAIPYDEVVKLNSSDEIRRPSEDDPEVVKYPKLKSFFYQRYIGGHWATKIAIGKTNYPIKKY